VKEKEILSEPHFVPILNQIHGLALHSTEKMLCYGMAVFKFLFFDELQIRIVHLCLCQQVFVDRDRAELINVYDADAQKSTR